MRTIWKVCFKYTDHYCYIQARRLVLLWYISLFFVKNFILSRVYVLKIDISGRYGHSKLKEVKA